MKNVIVVGVGGSINDALQAIRKLKAAENALVITADSGGGSIGSTRESWEIQEMTLSLAKLKKSIKPDKSKFHK